MILLLKRALAKENGYANLFHRLEQAVITISKSPKTDEEVKEIFVDFVLSIEEIAMDLRVMSDKQMSEKLHNIKEAVR